MKGGLIGAILTLAFCLLAFSRPALAETRVTQAVASCREGPREAAPRVTMLDKDVRVEVSRTSKGWRLVDRPGQDCWIPAGALQGSGIATFGATRPRPRPTVPYYDNSSACPCSSGRVCIGPRDGRYCTLPNGAKRYGS